MRVWDCAGEPRRADEFMDRSTEWPDDQAVISFILLDNACTTPPPSSFFLKSRLERRALITDTELLREISMMCAETCKCRGL